MDFRRARVFFTIFTALIVAGAGLALILGLPVIRMLVAVQVLNGALLPIVLVFILRLVNDERVAGELKNTRTYNVLGWGTFALVTAAVMLGTQVLGLLGLEPFGR